VKIAMRCRHPMRALAAQHRRSLALKTNCQAVKRVDDLDRERGLASASRTTNLKHRRGCGARKPFGNSLLRVDLLRRPDGSTPRYFREMAHRAPPCIQNSARV